MRLTVPSVGVEISVGVVYVMAGDSHRGNIYLMVLCDSLVLSATS